MKSQDLKSYQEDSEIVSKLKIDDIDAFDEAYARYSERLYVFGLKYLRIPGEAEELVQNIFVRVWENRRKLKVELSFKAYLFTLAYNDICKYYRKKKYIEKYISEAIRDNPDGTYSIVEKLDSRSMLDRIQKVLEGLPENHRRAFLESKMEGKTAKEIAHEIGITPATVDNYVSEVNKLLKRRLAAEDINLAILFLIFISV
jgi:RNA polymerase sigma-70 factor (family 1)